MPPAHLGQEPDRQRAGVGAGLVGVIGDLLDGAEEILLGIQVELVMVGAVGLGDIAEVGALVASLRRWNETEKS